jgi:hypothetical protein
MTMKLRNCSTSSRRRSREALGMVKYFFGLRLLEMMPFPSSDLLAISAVALTSR